MPHEWYSYMGIEWVLNTNSVPIHSDLAKTRGNANPLLNHCWNRKKFTKRLQVFNDSFCYSKTDQNKGTQVQEVWIVIVTSRLAPVSFTVLQFALLLQVSAPLYTCLQVTFCHRHLFHYLLFKPPLHWHFCKVRNVCQLPTSNDPVKKYSLQRVEHLWHWAPYQRHPFKRSSSWCFKEIIMVQMQFFDSIVIMVQMHL